MRQYWNVKSLHKDKIVLFRMGDFFEMFHGDAEKAAPILNIVLTARNKKSSDQIKMCGVPHHSVAGPISKLLAAGFKVVICDQMESASQAKVLVKREVTRILSPGMVYDPESLNTLQANYLCAFDAEAVSFLEASTGESFFYLSSDPKMQKQLIFLLRPVELVFTSEQKTKYFDGIEWESFHPSLFDDSVERRNEIQNMFESKDWPLSAYRLLAYLKAHQGLASLKSLRPFQKRVLSQQMEWSQQSQEHLEIFKTYKGEKRGSLFFSIHRTRTAPGARLLQSRIQTPSTNRLEIEKRLDDVEYWRSNPEKMNVVREKLSQVGDIERRLGKIAHPHCHAQDLLGLASSLRAGLEILPLWPKAPISSSIVALAKEQETQITRTIRADASAQLQSGCIIRKEVSKELDQLIEETNGWQMSLRRLEERERRQTNISSLKVRYNSIFGYYIEVTKIHSKKVPSHYIRKQTLAQAERYTTEKLQGIEVEVLSSRAKRVEVEQKIFESLRKEILDRLPDLFYLSRVLCEIDLSSSLAYLSIERNYVRPQFSSENQFVLVNSRHPVLEQELDRTFVPNTIRMKPSECLLLTGPNMAGKSTLMRQVALSTILAQAGVFVPAEQALLPIFHKLFTRIGASDSLSQGLSTFMVEMKESAEILRNADEHSLIILDEIGRGTATYDGMSLAQAILEYLVEKRKSLIFFATHYHELTHLAKDFSRIRNAHLSVREKKEGEKKEEIDFLYTLSSGATYQSYGVQVARLAGFPLGVIQQAEALLRKRELASSWQEERVSSISSSETGDQRVPSTSSSRTTELDPSTRALIKEIENYPLQEKSPLETMGIVENWKQEIERNKRN